MVVLCTTDCVPKLECPRDSRAALREVKAVSALYSLSHVHDQNARKRTRPSVRAPGGSGWRGCVSSGRGDSGSLRTHLAMTAWSEVTVAVLGGSAAAAIAARTTAALATLTANRFSVDDGEARPLPPLWAQLLCGHTTGSLSSTLRAMLWLNCASVTLDLLSLAFTADFERLTMDDISTIFNTCGCATLSPTTLPPLPVCSITRPSQAKVHVTALAALLHLLPRRSARLYSLLLLASSALAALYVVSLSCEMRNAMEQEARWLWLGLAGTDVFCLVMWLQIAYFVRLLIRQWSGSGTLLSDR